MELSAPNKRAASEAFLLLHVEQALLAVPVSSIAPPEQQGQPARLDLACLCGLIDQPVERPNSITLQSAAGPVALGIDAAADLLHVKALLPLPPLTRLQNSTMLRGLLPVARQSAGFAVAVDGVLLGELIAKEITESLEQTAAISAREDDGGSA